MKIRFLEYKKDLYISVGITYDSSLECPECFVAVRVDDIKPNIARSMLDAHTVKIPFSQATEITNKNKLLALMVLYGW